MNTLHVTERNPRHIIWNQFSSVVQSCLTLCDPMNCSMPGFPVHHQLSELAQNSCSLSGWYSPTIWSSVIPFSSHLQFFLHQGSNESVLCIRWPKYWSFSFSISPSVRGVCNFLGSVSSQQNFEAMDIKTLSISQLRLIMSQLSDRSVLQLSDRAALQLRVTAQFI